MNNNHTPGTWYAKEGQIYPIETGKPLALIPYFDAENKEQEANAKLIAAAPELFKMVYDLKQAVNKLSQDGLTQFDRDTEAQIEGEAHELLYRINPDYYI